MTKLILYNHCSNRLCFIGSIISAGASLIGASKQNKAAAKEGQKSRDFTEEQMKNKHQWEVADLRKAGLNPVLSAHGSGAVGGSAMAAVPANIGEGVNSAIALQKLNAEIDLLDAEADKSRTQASLNQAATGKTHTETAGIKETNKAKANIGTIAESVQPIIQDLPQSAKRVYDYGRSETPKIWEKLKKAPSDYGRFGKQTAQKFWQNLKGKFK